MWKVLHRTIFLFITTPVLCCCNPAGQKKAAEEAKQKSDSLLNEFKKVNKGLDSLNKLNNTFTDSI